MKRGRIICETLKSVRKSIAEANNICYEPRECNHKGDCNGTCPACEAEVKYIESELSLRKQMGEVIRIAGVAAGIGALAMSCTYNSPSQNSTDNSINMVDVSDTTKEFITIRGNITDERGKPVVSAFVGPMKTGETVKTDQKGNFCVMIPCDSLLRVRYIGYKDKEYKLSDLKVNGFNTLCFTEDDLDVIVMGEIAVEEVEEEYTEGNMPNYIIVKDSTSAVKDSTKLKIPNREN